MLIGYMTIKDNLIHGLACWIPQHRVTGSNPNRIRTLYCL